MDSLRVELFGGPRVRDRRAALVRLSPLQLALVAIIYGHGPSIRRDRAASLLWASGPDSDVRHRIRQLLVEIRTRCDGLIDTHGDALLPANGVECDLAHFESALEAGSLAAAGSLIARGFAAAPLHGVSDAYLDWRAAVEAALARRLKGRAQATWSRAMEREDWVAARESAEALYGMDPGSADCVRMVIEARGRTGDAMLAEAAFAAYMERSDEDGDTSPVHDAIRRVRRAMGAGAHGPRAEAATPLIGRREALAAARAAFDQVDDGKFTMMLIAGESGIGKTRLLQELQHEARFREFRCLSAQAVELESRIPLNPLLDALRSIDLAPHLDALGPPWNAVIAAVLPPGTLAGPVGELPPIQERALPRRLLDAFSLLLQRLSREQRTILFIDDLHWVDTTTITALQFMQRRWAGGPFVVMAAIRTDLVRRDEPVSKYLSQADGLVTSRVELRELSLDDGMQLVQHVAQGQIDEQRCRRICALAGLHPLCLLELTRDHLNGRLGLTDPPPTELEIPVSLEQIVAARLEQLDPRSRRIAGFLAVGTRPMRVRTAAALAGMTLEDAADAVEDLRRARLVESEHDRVRIVHELFRSAIYRDLGEPRRSMHHKAIAERIEMEEGDSAVGELAIHYDRAGECDLAARAGWIAADRAMETGTVAEAGHFYQLVAKNERDAVRRADATAGQARALHMSRDLGRANPVLELAAFQLRSVGKRAEALRLEIKRIEGLAETGAVPLPILTDSLTELKRQASEGDDWEALALALDAELHLLHRTSDLQGIRRLFEEMRQVATKGSLEAAILANAGLALGVLYGDPREALQAAELAVAMSAGSKEYRLLALMRLILVRQSRGLLQLKASEAIVREARSLSERSGDVLLRFSIESNLAVALLDAGEIEQAEVLMDAATRILATAGMDISRFNLANNRAELALAQGDHERAAQCYRDARAFLGSTMPSYMQDLVAAGLGLCAFETGDLRGARRREQELSNYNGPWHFDPTTILTFRARLLDRRSQHLEAIGLLDAGATDLQDRLVLAWLKVRLVQVRLMMKRAVPGAYELARIALERARDLNLQHRTEEFRELLLVLDRKSQ